jgi:hypothetical protein
VHLANFGTGAGASTVDRLGLREGSDGPAKDNGGGPDRLSGTRGVKGQWRADRVEGRGCADAVVAIFEGSKTAAGMTDMLHG